MTVITVGTKAPSGSQAVLITGAKLQPFHNSGHNGYFSDTSAAVHETGVIEKVLTSYGLIQYSEHQARLFFHCSQYNDNLQGLKVRDDIDFAIPKELPFGDKDTKYKVTVLEGNHVRFHTSTD
ncbi:hypothetical protein mRhiFer1_007908 [Rhinolophus ferrumequinum]|uniref:CSD domain-containing protein n=1 Tax=Rhinolophus ferrumequinum TaxID=59479 RepID=A0A7J8AV94_RHIFE|nr:hypothetical protein mRhiFer1_007908 [Rhinolophus ferrumequinum]